jgi:hypothetical protein
MILVLSIISPAIWWISWLLVSMWLAQFMQTMNEAALKRKRGLMSGKA